MAIMEEFYTRINWKDAPSEETPISAENLNKMDEAIKTLDSRVSQQSEHIEDLEQNGTGSGVTTAMSESLWTIIQKTAFTEALTEAELTAFKTAWGIETGGEEEPDIPDVPDEPDVPVVTTYTITNNLTNVSTDNPVATITENSGYTAILTPDTDFEFESVTVTMGGVDVTSDVYTNGAIVISAVTGNIVITAVAIQQKEEVVFLDYVELSGGAYFDTGITANMKNKYLIGIMTPEISSQQFFWGTRGRNNASQDASDYYDDVFAITSLTGAKREVKGQMHSFSMYDSASMQGINGSDNKSNLVPWYLYTKWDANALEAYSNEDMTSPLGATEFKKGSLSSNYFPYALNFNDNGAEFTLEPEKSTPSNVYLGKVNTTLGGDNMSKYPVPVDGMKYYVYKVWSESDVLLMHLRPAKMGAKVGMYDVVSSTFFESPDGTVTEGNEVA